MKIGSFRNTYLAQVVAAAFVISTVATPALPAWADNAPTAQSRQTVLGERPVSDQPVVSQQAVESNQVPGTQVARTDEPTSPLRRASSEPQTNEVSIENAWVAPPPNLYRSFEDAARAMQKNIKVTGVRLHAFQEDPNSNPFIQGKQFLLTFSFDMNGTRYSFKGRDTFQGSAILYNNNQWGDIGPFGMVTSHLTEIVTPPSVTVGTVQAFDPTAPQDSKSRLAFIDYLKKNPSLLDAMPGSESARINNLKSLDAGLASRIVSIRVGARSDKLSIEIIHDPCVGWNAQWQGHRIACTLPVWAGHLVAKAVVGQSEPPSNTQPPILTVPSTDNETIKTIRRDEDNRSPARSSPPPQSSDTGYVVSTSYSAQRGVISDVGNLKGEDVFLVSGMNTENGTYAHLVNSKGEIRRTIVQDSTSGRYVFLRTSVRDGIVAVVTREEDVYYHRLVSWLYLFNLADDKVIKTALPSNMKGYAVAVSNGLVLVGGGEQSTSSPQLSILRLFDKNGKFLAERNVDVTNSDGVVMRKAAVGTMADGSFVVYGWDDITEFGKSEEIAIKVFTATPALTETTNRIVTPLEPSQRFSHVELLGEGEQGDDLFLTHGQTAYKVHIPTGEVFSIRSDKGLGNDTQPGTGEPTDWYIGHQVAHLGAQESLALSLGDHGNSPGAGPLTKMLVLIPPQELFHYLGLKDYPGEVYLIFSNTHDGIVELFGEPHITVVDRNWKLLTPTIDINPLLQKYARKAGVSGDYLTVFAAAGVEVGSIVPNPPPQPGPYQGLHGPDYGVMAKEVGDKIAFDGAVKLEHDPKEKIYWKIFGEDGTTLLQQNTFTFSSSNPRLHDISDSLRPGKYYLAVGRRINGQDQEDDRLTFTISGVPAPQPQPQPGPGTEPASDFAPLIGVLAGQQEVSPAKITIYGKGLLPKPAGVYPIGENAEDLWGVFFSVLHGDGRHYGDVIVNSRNEIVRAPVVDGHNVFDAVQAEVFHYFKERMYSDLKFDEVTPRKTFGNGYPNFHQYDLGDGKRGMRGAEYEVKGKKYTVNAYWKLTKGVWLYNVEIEGLTSPTSNGESESDDRPAPIAITNSRGVITEGSGTCPVVGSCKPVSRLEVEALVDRKVSSGEVVEGVITDSSGVIIKSSALTSDFTLNKYNRWSPVTGILIQDGAFVPNKTEQRLSETEVKGKSGFIDLGDEIFARNLVQRLQRGELKVSIEVRGANGKLLAKQSLDGPFHVYHAPASAPPAPRPSETKIQSCVYDSATNQASGCDADRSRLLSHSETPNTHPWPLDRIIQAIRSATGATDIVITNISDVFGGPTKIIVFFKTQQPQPATSSVPNREYQFTEVSGNPLNYAGGTISRAEARVNNQGTWVKLRSNGSNPLLPDPLLQLFFNFRFSFTSSQETAQLNVNMQFPNGTARRARLTVLTGSTAADPLARLEFRDNQNRIVATYTLGFYLPNPIPRPRTNAPASEARPWPPDFTERTNSTEGPQLIEFHPPSGTLTLSISDTRRSPGTSTNNVSACLQDRGSCTFNYDGNRNLVSIVNGNGLTVAQILKFQYKQQPDGTWRMVFSDDVTGDPNAPKRSVSRIIYDETQAVIPQFFPAPQPALPPVPAPPSVIQTNPAQDSGHSKETKATATVDKADGLQLLPGKSLPLEIKLDESLTGDNLAKALERSIAKAFPEFFSSLPTFLKDQGVFVTVELNGNKFVAVVSNCPAGMANVQCIGGTLYGTINRSETDAGGRTPPAPAPQPEPPNNDGNNDSNAPPENNPPTTHIKVTPATDMGSVPEREVHALTTAAVPDGNLGIYGLNNQIEMRTMGMNQEPPLGVVDLTTGQDTGVVPQSTDMLHVSTGGGDLRSVTSISENGLYAASLVNAGPDSSGVGFFSVLVEGPKGPNGRQMFHLPWEEFIKSGAENPLAALAVTNTGTVVTLARSHLRGVNIQFWGANGEKLNSYHIIPPNYLDVSRILTDGNKLYAYIPQGGLDVLEFDLNATSTGLASATPTAVYSYQIDLRDINTGNTIISEDTEFVRGSQPPTFVLKVAGGGGGSQVVRLSGGKIEKIIDTGVPLSFIGTSIRQETFALPGGYTLIMGHSVTYDPVTRTRPDISTMVLVSPSGQVAVRDLEPLFKRLLNGTSRDFYFLLGSVLKPDGTIVLDVDNSVMKWTGFGDRIAPKGSYLLSFNLNDFFAGLGVPFKTEAGNSNGIASAPKPSSPSTQPAQKQPPTKSPAPIGWTTSQVGRWGPSNGRTDDSSHSRRKPKRPSFSRWN